ncbi:MAG: glycosyl hydrolase 115 family protein [Clostridia bacterium]|nr:glycosyl hydrolase 115 family protein [Clostridia bacterium]
MKIYAGETLTYCDLSHSAAVALAIDDLRADFADVMGVTLAESSEADAKLLIGTTLPEELKGQFEGHAIRVEGDRICLSGSDERGLMWAIYTLCGEYLGVYPLYFWADRVKPHLDELEVRDYVSAPFAVKYRGWFINDEDLLTGFEKTEKRRDVDYPFYHTVVSDRLMKRIAEAALRSKMNLIIPASLMNIDNPDERTLCDICAGRGLYLSMHHIEPLGVSSFTWDTYWAKKGEAPEQSYFRCPERYHEIWRYYAKLWARYPNVIWQLGLRGRGDKQVWTLDRDFPVSDAERGAIISRAIAEQYEIVREALGHENFVSTSTLWLEAGPLMEKGCLTFPDSTIRVFSDIGYSQQFGGDLTSAAVSDEGRGVYYHCAFIGAGPHLVRGTSAEKMLANMRLALAKGCDDYAIMNVSNIREFCENIDLFAAITREGGDVDVNRVWGENAELSKRFYAAYPEIPGGAVMLDGMTEHFGIRLTQFFEKPQNKFSIHYYAERDLYAHPDFQSPADAAEWVDGFFKRGIAAMEEFLASVTKRASVPEKDDRYFRSQYLYQPRIILGLWQWGHAVCQTVIERDAAYADQAVLRLEDAEAAMAENCYKNEAPYLSDWTGWYAECNKVSLKRMKNAALKLASIIREG